MSSDMGAAARMANRYRQVIFEFINGEMSPPEFERSYLSLFKSDTTKVGGEKFDILDKLFADVDAFVEDPELRDRVYGSIDSEELLDCAREAYRKLYES